MNQLKLQDAKEVIIPGARDEGRTTQDQDEKLDEDEATKFRAIIARLNYLFPDRPDI